MRYGSVCSGIEAATVAWHPLGWQPVFFAEIEPFPSAVLAHHYPDVPNLGDFTKIGLEYGHEYIGAIDLLVGGTPCQSFSVAGQRAGLDDPRGNLAIEFFKLARRLQATWVVWENVPGVHSSYSDVADCSSEETPDGCEDFIQSADFKTLLDIVSECGYSCAWRILDAQFTGVPQRRRRVFLVGHSGDDWRPPVAILFEPDRLPGDSAAGGEAGEDVAGTLGCRATAGGGLGTDFELGGGNSVAGCLNASGKYDRGDSQHASFLVPVGVPDKSLCLNGGGMKRIDGESETFIPFDTTQITSKENGCNQQPGAPCHPLAAGAHAPCIAFGQNQYGNDAGEEISPSLHCGGKDGGGVHTAVVAGFLPDQGSNAQGMGFEVEMAPTLRRDQGNPGLLQNMQVRRLTPRECERLQGFPDDYTLIRYHGKPAADGPRYRALGNSMAVPCMRWIGARIALFEEILREVNSAK